MSAAALQLGASLSVAFATGIFTFGLARVPMAPLPAGPRGRSRERSRTRGLGAVEPLLRRLATLVAELPLPNARARVEGWLTRGGEFLGLGPDEVVALSLLSSVCGLAAGAALAACGLPGAPPLCLVLGALWPWLALRRTITTRTRELVRTLPGAIDLLALCLGAGLDFNAALSLVAHSLGAGHPALCDELTRILQELALGHTRAQTLRAFASRVPIATVHELAFAVVQADQKGSALAPVLAAQARMIRMRRSVEAEQAAARASVLLIAPLMLLMAAILIVLFAPFAIDGLGI
jgi:tight adherence protein C